jgi:N-carbamoyl-L-amino-acid hydrolase
MDASMRLSELFNQIADIGLDPTSGGYRRFAYTREDVQLREFFAATAKRLGLSLSVDAAHNQWAWWGDPDRNRSENLVLGSHLDSVPSGGAYDGPLGVLSAFVAVEALMDEGFHPSAAIGIVNFSDEEGARFGVACLGSRVLTGETDRARLAQLRDYDDIPFDRVLAEAGVAPVEADDQALARIGRFIELHIEQGHQLIALDAPVGLASFIWPHGRWSTVITGTPNHAGTTKLTERDDPLWKASHFVLDLADLAIARDAIATCGKVIVEPNAINAVAALVRLWVDARAESAQVLDELAADITELAGRFDAGLVNESLTPMTVFDSALTARIGAILGEPPVISTGAGHDAGILANHGVPAAMLFVRNPTGVSHSPEEAATQEDMDAGVQALITVIRGLAP